MGCNPARDTTSHPSPPSIQSTRTISRRYLRQLFHAPPTLPSVRIVSRSCQLDLGQKYQYRASTGRSLKLRPRPNKTRTSWRVTMKTPCLGQVLTTSHKRATSSLKPNHSVFNSSVPRSSASPKTTNSSKMRRLAQVRTPFPSQPSLPSRLSLASALESLFASSRDKTASCTVHHAVPRTKISTWRMLRR